MPKITVGNYLEALHDIFVWEGNVYNKEELEAARKKKPKSTAEDAKRFHAGIWYYVEWVKKDGVRVCSDIGGAYYFKDFSSHFKFADDGGNGSHHEWRKGTFTPRESFEHFELTTEYHCHNSGPAGCVFHRSRGEHGVVFLTWEEMDNHFIDYDQLRVKLRELDMALYSNCPLMITPTVNIYVDGQCTFKLKKFDPTICFHTGKEYKVLGITYQDDGETLLFKVQSDMKGEENSPMWLSRKSMRYIAPALILSESESKITEEPDPVTDQVSWTHWFLEQHQDASLDLTRKEWIVACASALHGDKRTPSKGMREVAREAMMGRGGFPPFMPPFGPFGCY